MNTQRGPQKVTVRVPATTANLGPGFDALGLALALYNRFEVEPLPEGYVVEMVPGTGGAQRELRQLPRGADNLVVQAVRETWKTIGLPPGGWRVRIAADIPLAAGLGSSATAIVGGVVAANALAGDPLSQEELLQIAIRLEGHADNVAPALLGGFTVVVADDVSEQPAADGISGTPVWLRFVVEHIEAIVAVPDQPLATGRSRGALPDTVSHRDAAFNVGRASLLTAAMASGDLSAVAAALTDRLHQPYREQLVPGFSDVVQAARREGALGAVLSGAGPSVVALVPAGTRPEPIGIAMVAAFREAGIGAHWLALKADRHGAVIEHFE